MLPFPHPRQPLYTDRAIHARSSFANVTEPALLDASYRLSR